MFIIKACITFCVAFYAAKAMPQNFPILDEAKTEVLTALGLAYKDDFDYNEYILNLEAVVEKVQQVALQVTENAVELGVAAAKVLGIYGSQESIWRITDIQSSMFKKFEDDRYHAFLKDIDISPCVTPAIQMVYNSSQEIISTLKEKLDNLTATLNNYTSVTYTTPASACLEKSYTVRARIYQCPFNFTDFAPFYLCLTLHAVLDDIITLNEFSTKFNESSSEIYTLVTYFKSAANAYEDIYVDSFNSSSQDIYTTVFLPCAKENGYTP